MFQYSDLPFKELLKIYLAKKEKERALGREYQDTTEEVKSLTRILLVRLKIPDLMEIYLPETIQFLVEIMDRKNA